jgi:hypothetical protein
VKCIGSKPKAVQVDDVRSVLLGRLRKIQSTVRVKTGAHELASSTLNGHGQQWIEIGRQNGAKALGRLDNERAQIARSRWKVPTRILLFECLIRKLTFTFRIASCTPNSLADDSIHSILMHPVPQEGHGLLVSVRIPHRSQGLLVIGTKFRANLGLHKLYH